MQELLRAARQLSDQLSQLRFAPPVAFVYNPLEYVWDGYEQYVTRYARRGIHWVMVGMNPGPWGMLQTGVPFGEVTFVREWLGIRPRFTQPSHVHPLRPVEGVECRRSEVSGGRLWGLLSTRYGDPQTLFRDGFVANYCPLGFLESTARNRTPDKLPVAERKRLYELCNAHLATVVATLKPQHLIAVGQFAEERAREALSGRLPITRILHPSPASPASNRDWAGAVTKQLRAAEIWDA